MLTSPALEAIDAHTTSPPHDANIVDPTIEIAYASLTVTGVDLDLAGDLASFSDAQG